MSTAYHTILTVHCKYVLNAAASSSPARINWLMKASFYTKVPFSLIRLIDLKVAEVVVKLSVRFYFVQHCVQVRRHEGISV